ncbi:hypothetical protein [Streptomyces prasinopilosus]|uniref:hypothetical protein n=1 Tax=Streptomyces prasinopilosus TaxID=67344 RepID=UPI0006EB58A9|nr:hypothetical protein [Streptomyces prasinopilosus]
MTHRPMSARRARAVVDAATLVKAPDWRESRCWHVVSGGAVLVVVEPSYGGTSATGRNGWTWRLPTGGASRRRETTIEKAAIAGLAAWERWATNKEK